MRLYPSRAVHLPMCHCRRLGAQCRALSPRANQPLQKAIFSYSGVCAGEWSKHTRTSALLLPLFLALLHLHEESIADAVIQFGYHHLAPRRLPAGAPPRPEHRTGRNPLRAAALMPTVSAAAVGRSSTIIRLHSTLSVAVGPVVRLFTP